MKHQLLPFSTSSFKLEVDLKKTDSSFLIDYHLIGEKKELILPEQNASPLFKDGLWNHTCFEFFLMNGEEYLEYNFSPSGDFAFYFFENYRIKKTIQEKISSPIIVTKQGFDHLNLQVTVPIIEVEKINLTAVIETQYSKEYFALSHKKEKPDFHDPASFILL